MVFHSSHLAESYSVNGAEQHGGQGTMIPLRCGPACLRIKTKDEYNRKCLHMALFVGHGPPKHMTNAIERTDFENGFEKIFFFSFSVSVTNG